MIQKKMNRIQELFHKKKSGVLSIYFTAGFPALNDTGRHILALQKQGADMIEVGMPYSDPLADGPVIQRSSMQALQNGITISVLFDQLNEVKEQVKIPLVLMGYLNPVLQFGFEKFCRCAREAGVDGLILPDLPPEVYEKDYKQMVENSGLGFIFLVTPQTPEERIRKMDDLSKGFIYAVSSSSVTGREADLQAQQHYFERLSSLSLKNEILIGFGIRDHASFEHACRYAAGAVIGTAYIQAVADSVNIEEAAGKFLNSVLI